MEEVPLYGNLHYLKTGRKMTGGGCRGQVLGGWDEGLQEEEQELTRFLLPVPGRLSQEPGPDQQAPTPGGPTRVS